MVVALLYAPRNTVNELLVGVKPDFGIFIGLVALHKW